MKKFLLIIVLSLFLKGCGGAAWDSPAKKINFSKHDYKIKQDTFYYQTIRVLSKKPKPSLLTYDFNKGMFYGFGNTPQEAINDANNQCEDYKKTKESLKNLFCISTGLQTYHSHLNYSDVFLTKYGRYTAKKNKPLIERQEREKRNALVREQRIEGKRIKCESYGFKINTEKMAECILRLTELDKAYTNNNSQGITNAQAALLALGIITSNQNSNTQLRSNRPRSSSGGFLTRSSVSGQYRTCYYQSGLGTKTKTVFAGAPCPLAY
jgi:hypothetical protein